MMTAAAAVMMAVVMRGVAAVVMAVVVMAVEGVMGMKTVMRTKMMTEQHKELNLNLLVFVSGETLSAAQRRRLAARGTGHNGG